MPTFTGRYWMDNGASAEATLSVDGSSFTVAAGVRVWVFELARPMQVAVGLYDTMPPGTLPRNVAGTVVAISQDDLRLAIGVHDVLLFPASRYTLAPSAEIDVLVTADTMARLRAALDDARRLAMPEGRSYREMVHLPILTTLDELERPGPPRLVLHGRDWRLAAGCGLIGGVGGVALLLLSAAGQPVALGIAVLVVLSIAALAVAGRMGEPLVGVLEIDEDVLSFVGRDGVVVSVPVGDLEPRATVQIFRGRNMQSRYPVLSLQIGERRVAISTHATDLAWDGDVDEGPDPDVRIGSAELATLARAVGAKPALVRRYQLDA